jgi:O-antigen/teichoic acid export membrane protein
LGLMVNALGSDYYPRLSGISDHNDEFNRLVNRQLNISLCFIGPIAIFCYLFSEPILEIFFSSEFKNTSILLKLLAISTIFRIVGTTLAIALMSKNNFKLFTTIEILLNVYFLLFYFLKIRNSDIGTLPYLFLSGYLFYSITLILASIFKTKLKFSLFTIIIHTIYLLIIIYLVISVELEYNYLQILSFIVAVLGSSFYFVKFRKDV